MPARRRVAAYVGAGVAIGLLLVVLGVLLLSQTDWGRERIRAVISEQLDRATAGRVEIGRVEGNLLRRIRLVDVTIVDEQERPFLRADTIETRFSLGGLLRQRIELADLRLVRPIIVLDQPPGQEWNYVRIFRLAPQAPERQGWGERVDLHDVEVVNGRVTVRTAWRPPDDVPPQDRERAIEKALAGETRENVVRVPGGYQNVMDFRQLNALLPRIVVAHPDSAGIPIEVARFSGTVQPFAPPAGEVRDLAGRFDLVRDSLHFRNVRAVLPESRLTAAGTYALGSGELVMEMHGRPLAFPDLRWLHPPLPEEGGGTMDLRVERRPLATRLIATDIDARVRDATIEGRLDVTVGDTLRLGPTDLRFARVETRLLERFVPGVEFPRAGELTGRFAARGLPTALQVDGDVRFTDAAGGGTSRILAAGELGVEPETRFRNLRLRFQPLQTTLARAVVPDLPVTGSIEGHATLTGRLGGLLQIDSDLALRDTRTGVSRIRAVGGVDRRGERLRLRDMRVRMDPLRADLLRSQLAQLPRGSLLIGQARLDGEPQRRLQVDGDVALHDPASGISRFGATGGVVLQDELRFDDLAVRMHAVQVDLLRSEFPDLPAGGLLRGTVRVDGSPAGMLQLAGTVRHEDERLGTSVVGLDGGIALQEPLRFRELELELEPLSMRLVRAFAPEMTLGGTLSGRATLDGSPADRIAVRGDLVHVEQGQRSRVSGRGTVVTGARGSATIDVELQPLSLVTVGRLAPAAGLRGSVRGQLTASGNLDALRVDTDLQVAGGGALRAAGTLDLAADQPGYDLDLRMSGFDLAAVTWRSPAVTALTGTARASGRGLEPATMRAEIAADLTGSAIDGVGADFVRLRLQTERGHAVIDSSVIRLGSAEAVLDGTFGLTAGRHGELAYRVTVDSLHTLAPWLPGADTAVAAPRLVALGEPADTVRDGVSTSILVADAVLGADSALVAAAEAEPPPVPTDSLAGRLEAEGTLRGNIEAFDVEGRARVDSLAYRGTLIGRGAGEYAVSGARTPTPDVTITAGAAEVVAGGLAFDTVAVNARYHGARYGDGSITAVALNGDDTEYRLDAEFTLALERNEIRVAEALLRLDTVTWQTARPGAVRWGGDGVEIADLELVSDDGGRIFAAGRLTAEGTSDLRLVVESLEIAQLAALLQSDVEATGLLDLQAEVEGTLRSPLMQGTAVLRQVTVNGNDAPEVRAEFTYADRELSADAELMEEGRLLATADARLPVDLALTGDVRQRLLAGELAVDIRADSIPIEAIPQLSEHVRDARGRVAGAVSIRGTFESPILDGSVDLALGAVEVVPLGVAFDDITGRLSLAGTTLTIDTLAGYSVGAVRVTGQVDLASLTEPVFDLAVHADNARVVDLERARMRVDAELTITGPLSGVVVAGNAHARSGMIRVPTLDELGSGAVVNLDDPATYELADTVFRADRDRLFPRSRTLQNLSVDVGLTIDRDVWLRSVEANVEIYTPPEVGPLRIVMDGGESRLTLIGTINTDRGEYEFMSRRFALTRGAVTFAGEPELNPFLQVAAEHEVRMPGRDAFQLRVVIGGTLQDFSLTLESTSQPPISQTDLLSYLAFGRDASSLLFAQGSALSGRGAGTGALVGNVAGIATQQLAAVAVEAVVNEIEQEAMRELRLDVFRITPAPLPPEMFTGGYADVLRGTEIEAGRYISPRLFFAAQARAGLNRPGVRMEYRLPSGFQWLASWQPRFLPREPTLTEQDVRRSSVFGAFLLREWRF
jgi:translocation and assembly module TamB